MEAECVTIVTELAVTDVLRFFAHGDFTKAGVVPTLAPAMDITIPSNFERFLYHHSGNNAQWLKKSMDIAKDTIGFTMGVSVPGRERTSCCRAQQAPITCTCLLRVAPPPRLSHSE